LLLLRYSHWVPVTLPPPNTRERLLRSGSTIPGIRLFSSLLRTVEFKVGSGTVYLASLTGGVGTEFKVFPGPVRLFSSLLRTVEFKVGSGTPDMLWPRATLKQRPH
jgi:hypothetical protein